MALIGLFDRVATNLQFVLKKVCAKCNKMRSAYVVM